MVEFQNNPERSAVTGNTESDIYMTTYNGENKNFPSNTCKVVFSSEQMYKEGVNLMLLAHRRDWHIGTYEVDCEIDGKEIKLSKARGMFEHIWSRI